ncbi:hypothetical protein A9974_02120 [Achromobacter sp. UMC71]|nr:hypothetical protein [Achromobacter sp. UMC71]
MFEWRVLNLWIEMGKAIRDGSGCAFKRLPFPAAEAMMRPLSISRESEILARFGLRDFSTTFVRVDSAKRMMALALWGRQDDCWIKRFAATCAQGADVISTWITLGISAAST